MTTLATVIELQGLHTTYLNQFPEEQKLQYPQPKLGSLYLSLSHFLKTTSTEQLYSRKNFTGHLTASAFILSADGKSVLLLDHKSLNRWLQPGGHIDDTDNSILEAAYREVVEETGIAKEHLTLLSNNGDENIPFDIDSHYIPANLRKSEVEHVHHDFRYLLQVVDDAEIQISEVESNDFQWISLNDLLKIEDHQRVAEKIMAIVS